jgi:PAS domain S-box-containing protein
MPGNMITRRKVSQNRKEFAELRRRAEVLLPGRRELLRDLTGREKEELIHELQTYQAELEIQNEDLRGAQEEIEQSRNRYADLYDFAPVGYFTVDGNGVITSANLTAAGMLEKIRTELVGDHLVYHIAMEDRDRFFLFLRHTARKEGRQTVDVSLLPKDGRQRRMHLEGLPVRNSKGEIIEIRIAATDITELKEREEKITALNRELERSNADLLHFTFIVSHDLQEPLRTISSFVQLLVRRYGEKFDDKGRLFMQHIVEGADYMHDLLKDLLTYSRVGGASMDRRPVSLDAVLAKVKKALAESMKDLRAELTATPLPVVYGDEVHLTTLLQNLIGNALKYRSEEPPRIHVSAECSGENWILSVRDNGIGIDPRYADQIFLIFQRLHLRTEYEGTGIGLAICKKIAERHGGRIWVDSAPGRGSIFFVSLPAGREEMHG